MTAVVYGVSGIRGGLEDNACLDTTRCVIALILVVTKRVVSYARAEAGRRGAGGGLEFAGTLPLRATRQPKHQPVVGVVLFGEVGGKEEC